MSTTFPGEQGDYWVLVTEAANWQVVLVLGGKVFFHRGGHLPVNVFKNAYPSALWGDRLEPPSMVDVPALQRAAG